MLERLIRLRKELGLSQGGFAKRIGISQGLLSGIENGNEKLSKRNMRLICIEFGVQEDWLRFGKEPMLKESAPPVVIDGITLTQEARELLDLYDRLVSPAAKKDILTYTKEKLELQEFRRVQ